MKVLRIVSGLMLVIFCLSVHAESKINSTDPHSYANFNQVSIGQSHFEWYIDFEKRQINGEAEYTLKYHDASADELILDTRDLVINSVFAVSQDKKKIPLKFHPGARDKILGQALVISLAKLKPQKIIIDYHTTDKATGIQWLTAEQTAGKSKPFLFSQSQAIHARSWIPIQDTPAIRITWTANVRTSIPLKVVMSAQMFDDQESQGNKSVQRFSMQQPVPPYLLAIAAGRLASKKIGPRTRVYAEPETLEAAAAEFADTESMIQITEKLYGPYAWDEYNLLILPPSFPMGGMENPRLSFITPTVIAGDKSLVSLIAHELAHSWSGNLVTNNNWNSLWLNEGFTTWLENRVMEALYGKDRADMERLLAYQELLEELKELKPVDKTIVGHFEGRDPDDAFTGLPYTKGMLCLKYFENKIGRKKFDQFIRSYFDKFRFESVSTDTFVNYFSHYFKDHSQIDEFKSSLHQWLYDSEWVSDFIPPKSQAFVEVETMAAGFLNSQLEVSAIPFARWNAQQQIHFLRNLLPRINIAQMVKLDKAFEFTKTGNNEVVHVWLLMSIKTHYKQAEKRLEHYVSHIGRERLILPLFKAMMADSEWQKLAINIYQSNKSFYHPTVAARIETVLSKGQD